MKTRFRLISEVKIFISGNNLYIASPDSKSCISKVKALIPKTDRVIEEIQLELEDLTLRITNKLDLVVSSNNLPGGLKKEYVLSNYDKNYLGDLIESLSIDKGKFSSNFEPALNDEEGTVILVCPEMPSYKEASNEMIRRMNCQMLKKTKTYIPGHRYDTVDNTYYYLGKVYSHVITDQNSDYIKISTKPVYLFTRDIGFAKTISEVLNGGAFYFGNVVTDYYKLEQSDSLGLLVDSGEALINDYTSYEDYLNNIFRNSLEINTITSYPYGIKTVFEGFKFSENQESNISDITKYELIDFIKKDIKRVLYTFWDNSEVSKGGRLELSSVTPKEELSTRCITRYITEVLDPNIKKHAYYNNLVQGLGIDLNTLVDNIFNEWDPSILEQDFDIFVEYNRGEPYTVRLRTMKSSKYSTHLTIVKLSEVLKNEHLIDCIKEMCTYIRSNSGIGCSLYEKINVGTLSKPLVYENITITSRDIINYYKERGFEIPENLKYGILDDKFLQVNINVDLGEIIE